MTEVGCDYMTVTDGSRTTNRPRAMADPTASRNSNADLDFERVFLWERKILFAPSAPPRQAAWRCVQAYPRLLGERCHRLGARPASLK
jgi:hypothetical protein